MSLIRIHNFLIAKHVFSYQSGLFRAQRRAPLPDEVERNRNGERNEPNNADDNNNDNNSEINESVSNKING